jgi:hypothetical protein
MLHPPDVHPQQKSQSRLLSLLARHPLGVLGLGWGILLVFAAFSLATLLSPGQKSPQTEVLPSASSPETITTPVPPATSSSPESQSPPEPGLPILATPFQSLESEETAASANLPLWIFGAIALSCAGGSLLLTLVLKQASANSTRRRKAARRRKKRSTLSRRQSQRVPSPRQQPTPEPQVTILPPDISHPLDGDQEDLAAEMDLRRHHSLSSLLRDSSENHSS